MKLQIFLENPVFPLPKQGRLAYLFFLHLKTSADGMGVVYTHGWARSEEATTTVRVLAPRRQLRASEVQDSEVGATCFNQTYSRVVI